MSWHNLGHFSISMTNHKILFLVRVKFSKSKMGIFQLKNNFFKKCLESDKTHFQMVFREKFFSKLCKCCAPYLLIGRQWKSKTLYKIYLDVLLTDYKVSIPRLNRSKSYSQTPFDGFWPFSPFCNPRSPSGKGRIAPILPGSFSASKNHQIRSFSAF